MTPFSSRMSRVTPSAIMELLKTAAGGEFINFASGLPEAELFPHDTLREITDDILTSDWKSALQYGSAEGYPPLRELVAERLKQRGLKASADNILITHGSQQALDLAARVFLDRGDTVVLESPSYLAAIQAFDSYEVDYAPTPMDEDGVDADNWTRTLRRLVGEGARILQFVLPNFQNPTGITLHVQRRQKLAEATAEVNIPLLEDDAYYDLRYQGDALPPIVALANNPFAVYTGTFSKTIAPGIRVGWIHGSKEVIARLAQLKQITDLHSGSLVQRIAFAFCTRRHLEPQIQCLCDAHRAKRDTMLRALDREMPSGVSWTKPQGGMFIFVTLPEGMDAEALLDHAMKEKLIFVPGRSFFPPADSNVNTTPGIHGHRGSTPPRAGVNTLRLNFVSPKTEEIEQGIALLASLIRATSKLSPQEQEAKNNQTS